MIDFRCHRVGRSLVALQRTPSKSLPSLSQRNRSDENGMTYGNVYRVSIQIPDSFNSIPEETRILLRSNKIGFVRGGTMEDVRKRVRAFQTGTPFLLTLEKAYRCPTPDIYEKYFHQVFKSQRGIGEWFDLSEKNKCEMNNIMEELDRSGKFNGDATLLENIQFEKEKRSSIGSTETEYDLSNLVLEQDETNRTKTFGGGTITRQLESIDQYNTTNIIGTKRELSKILRGHRIDLEENSDISTRRYLSHKDKAVVISALENHPDASKKIGCGVDTIFVKSIWKKKGRNSVFSYCFYVKRVDGSEEDFSYLACFGGGKILEKRRNMNKKNTQI